MNNHFKINDKKMTVPFMFIHICPFYVFPVTPDFSQWFLLYFNYLNLTCSLSLLNRKLTWPNIRKTTSYEGRLESLIAKKNDLLKLKSRLSES